MTIARGRVVLAGAFDTKGDEYAFVRDRLAASGVRSLLVDTGVLGSPSLAADITRDVVARAGGAAIDELARRGDRGEAMVVMARGAARVIGDLFADGSACGVVVLGGSNAGFVMARIAEALPLGVPKLLVSTIVAGDTRPYVGVSDLTMMYPVVDIAGLNSISIPVLSQAADAVAGMVSGPPVAESPHDGPTVACTMFGVTTTCVTAVHDALVAQGTRCTRSTRRAPVAARWRP